MFFVFCNKKVTDIVEPSLDLNVAGTFPVNCDTLYFGNTYSFRYFLRDNIELYSLTIEITHNFDGHTHSSSLPVCHPIDPKNAIYPFFYSNEFLLPQHKCELFSDAIIWFPAEDCCQQQYDAGDYHLRVKVLDKAGLSYETTLNVKILHGNQKAYK